MIELESELETKTPGKFSRGFFCSGNMIYFFKELRIALYTILADFHVLFYVFRLFCFVFFGSFILYFSEFSVHIFY